jgi:predicted DCC family thiol-disulfide oxidoreductase YuxK
MQSLTVLFDARCSLCLRARVWLEGEPQLVPLRFVAAGSAEAHARFPTLDHEATLEALTVVSDSGEVFHGERAWLICLWALRSYREWSQRLATPALLPTVRRFVLWVSANRFGLGGEPCTDETCRHNTLPTPHSARG